MSRILHGHILDAIKQIPDGSVHCVVTSPPYWGLRNYGTDPQIWPDGLPQCEAHEWSTAPPRRKRKSTDVVDVESKQATNAGAQHYLPTSDFCRRCNAWRGELGLEPTPELYVKHMLEIFREVRRVLRDDGTLWLNLGDSYWAGKGQSAHADPERHMKRLAEGKTINRPYQEIGRPGWTAPKDGKHEIIKPKDLVGIPWMVAFALRADGWWLRSDIIWCLSGGTRVYARTQKGEMPMTIKDLVRLDPSTVQLWNGEKWTQVLGWNESKRGHPLEIELRSGERIGCTAGHLWPTQRGNVRTDELRVGDVIQSTRLPEPETPYSPAFIGHDVAWMLGLYLAEGSRDGAGRLQFAGHAEQNEERMAALRPLAEAFGGTARSYTNGNRGNVVVDCPALAAVVEQYIHGRSARTKGIKVRAWRHSDEWLCSLLRGYLDGDGHYDAPNDRWRLGFTRNDRLADDLRTLAARLGYTLTLKATTAEGYGKRWPVYRGEIRKARSGHHNERPRTEVVAIRRSRARKFWDIGVADEPHLFALASGVLTHNSKPNPMPESVTDRPTKSHEYIFLLTKSDRYFYDAAAIYEPAAYDGRLDTKYKGGNKDISIGAHQRWPKQSENMQPARNRRSVWTITTEPFWGAHFATFPTAIPEICIKAGTSQKGCCPKCGAPWERVVEKTSPQKHGSEYQTIASGRGQNADRSKHAKPSESRTLGWKPTCDCGEEAVIPCTVLDPFGGSGTTAEVAKRLGRDFILIELKKEYITELIEPRIGAINPLFAENP